MSQQQQFSTSKRQLANWVVNYADLINKFSESPENFNLWSAISMVGAVLKNRVWLNKGPHKVFPNQYIVLVGPSGIGKGIAMSPTIRFVKDPPNIPPLANYIQDKITYPKLCETLHKGFTTVGFNGNGNLLHGQEATCVLQATELATLLYGNDHMITFLTETWDKDTYVYSTKSGGSQPIKNMCVSLFGACTQDFIKLMSKNNTDPTNNGLTSRIVFVYGNKKSKILPFAPGFDAYPREVNALHADLQQISQMHGEYYFTSNTKDIYEKKYYEIEASISDDDSDVVRNFKARQAAHILKIAITLSAAGSDDLVISDWAMLTAISLVDKVQDTLDSAFRGIGDSPLAVSQDRIRAYIMSKGVCNRSEILRDNHRHITPDDLDRVLYVLKECRFIQEFTQAGKLYFKDLTQVKP